MEPPERMVEIVDQVAESGLLRQSQDSSTRKRHKRTSDLPQTENSIDEDSNCSICFEPYTNSGSHRLTCLKCGHLFGKSCIKRWLGKGSVVKNHACPQCKASAKISDIRNHYCRGVKVLDTSEKEALSKELQQERHQKREMQIELATLKQRCESLSKQVDVLKADLNKRQRNDDPIPNSSLFYTDLQPDTSSSHNLENNLNLNLKFVKKFDICREGDSRVMTFCHNLPMLVASGRQNSALFNKCGLKKVDLYNLRSTEFLPLHGDVIRDVKIDAFNALTASLDKTLCLSSLQNNCVVHKWNVGQRLWSCCFKSDQPFYTFAATQNGKVFMFDSRMIYDEIQIDYDQNSDQPAGCVALLCDLKKPIFGLHWLDKFGQSANSGLLVCSVDKCVFLSQNSAFDFQPHFLPLEGKLYSVSHHQPSGHLLVSYGPSSNKRLCVEHAVYELAYDGTDGRYTCNMVMSKGGGPKQTLMCRNLLSQNYRNRSQLLAYTYNESQQAVEIWNASTAFEPAHRKMPLSSDESIYDAIAVELDDVYYAGFLSNKSLTLHKF